MTVSNYAMLSVLVAVLAVTVWILFSGHKV